KGLHEFRLVIFPGKMRQQQVAEESCAMGFEKLQRLEIGQMAVSSPYPVFQEPGIFPIHQHFFIIIGFQKSRMALTEIMNQLIAGLANVGKNAHGCLQTAHDKTMGVAGVMFFGERRYLEAPYRNRLMAFNQLYKSPEPFPSYFP